MIPTMCYPYLLSSPYPIAGRESIRKRIEEHPATGQMPFAIICCPHGDICKLIR